jgi:hypothetical protein
MSLCGLDSIGGDELRGGRGLLRDDADGGRSKLC